MSDPGLPQIPPIPAVPIVQEDGRVTREWWRWFHFVFEVAQYQMGLIVGYEAFRVMPDPSASIEQSTLAALARLVPQDQCTPDVAARLAQVMAVPSDAVNQDQIVLQSLMSSVPA